jgi:uridylate kinase
MLYRRIQLKLSGEGLAGDEAFGISDAALGGVIDEIRDARSLGVQVAITIGGGNILRGNTFAGRSRIPEATAHYMGMLATVINALALQEALQSAGIEARVMSSFAVPSVCELFVRGECIRHLEAGRVMVLAAGTGRPFVTTDTAAALSAAEIGADALFKATQVDGVYSADPRKNPDARFQPALTYNQVIDGRLAVMDISAVDLCQRNRIPIVVFNLHKPGNLKRILSGEKVGTIISA